MTKYIFLLSIACLSFHACTKEQSPIPNISAAATTNNDSLANLDFTKYLGRILENGSCNGCHSGGGPGPGDFTTYNKLKITVLKSGNPMRTEGLGRMATCGGNFGCLNQLQKDSVSNWLQKYFSL
jgi:hypothetical protein